MGKGTVCLYDCQKSYQKGLKMLEMLECTCDTMIGNFAILLGSSPLYSKRGSKAFLTVGRLQANMRIGMTTSSSSFSSAAAPEAALGAIRPLCRGKYGHWVSCHFDYILGRPNYLTNLPDPFFWNPWSMYEQP